MSDNSWDFLTWEIFPGMSMWAFIIIVVSAITLFVITVLFIRIRRRERKNRKWEATYEVQNSKRRLQPKVNKTSIGTDNPGWEDYPDRTEEAHTGDEDPSALYAKPSKRSDRMKAKPEGPIEGPPQDGDSHEVIDECDDSSALYAQPIHRSDRKKDNSEGLPENTPTKEANAGGDDPESTPENAHPHEAIGVKDDSSSALYAQPIYNQPDLKSKDVTSDASEKDLGELEDPTALYALPIEPSDQLKEAIIASSQSKYERDNVPRESAPGSDVLYAKPMKTSFKVSGENQADDDVKVAENGGKLITVGAIALPEPSSMGGTTSSPYEPLVLATVEGSSHYEELDLSSVAKARMSTGDEIPLTDL